MEDRHETKYLIFSRFKIGKKKTYNVNIHNKSNELIGKIYWRTGWRTYVVTIEPEMDLDIKCWDEVSDYLKLLLQDRLDNMKK